MRIGIFPAIALCLTLGVATAQDANSPTAAQGEGGGRMGGGGWGMMGGGRGLMGTVTEAAGDHYTIKTEAGEMYTVHFSVNTRIMKQMVWRRGEERGANPPAPLKPDAIKVGDVIAANGEVDAAAKSVGAVFIVQLDPERARQLRELEASYGKTWLMGRITAIDGARVTLEGVRDRMPYTFMADENTTFRERREPITPAGMKVGDMVRVEGAVKDGTFMATTVGDVGAPQEGTTMMPRGNPPQ